MSHKLSDTTAQIPDNTPEIPQPSLQLPYNMPLSIEKLSAILSDINQSILRNLDGPLRYRLTNAYLFVAVLQKDSEALASLIAALLYIPRLQVLSAEIQNPIILGQTIDDKDCVLDLPVGADYTLMKPIIQIGILDFNYPNGNNEFYQEIFLMNRKTHKIFSDKASIHMLCLSQIENATPEDHASGLYQWAKLFKAATWKEMIDLSQNNPVMQNTVITIAQLSNEEQIRQQCERREKYERDRINAMNYSYNQGHDAAMQKFFRLNQKLIENNRSSEISKALSDTEYLRRLLAEFGIE